MNVKRQKLIDGSALGLSMLCLFHCLAMPFVVSVMPLLGAHLFEETTIHIAFFALALPLSFFGLWLGVKGAHGGAKLMWIAAFGLVLMFLGTLHDVVGELDVALTAVGVSFVGLAHFLNWRRHEKAHHHLPHDHLLHHTDDPCPCEEEHEVVTASPGERGDNMDSEEAVVSGEALASGVPPDSPKVRQELSSVPSK